MRDHQGDYGYDGSFHTVSAGAQVAGIGASSATPFAGAGVALGRGNRLAPWFLHPLGHRDQACVNQGTISS